MRWDCLSPGGIKADQRQVYGASTKGPCVSATHAAPTAFLFTTRSYRVTCSLLLLTPLRNLWYQLRSNRGRVRTGSTGEAHLCTGRTWCPC